MLITRLKSEETITSLCSGKVFIIKKLVLQVDVKKIKQLQDLLEIVGELEDKINSGEDPDDDPETDFALA